MKGQNSRSSQQPFDYDNRELLQQLRAKMDQLMGVKTAITIANGAIYERIFRLAELKDLIVAFRPMDTKQGVFQERSDFGGSALTVEYRTQIPLPELNNLIAGLEIEARQIQDELDEFNTTQAVAATVAGFAFAPASSL